jgi:hypothetical protein
VGTPLDRTFTVRNTGTANLTLNTPITAPAGFSVLSSFGSTTLATSQETTFTIRLNATAAGTFSGPVSFNNNDPNETPYNFFVTGLVGGTAPLVQIIDDGDAGFTATAGFTPFPGQGFQNDVRYAAAGSGTQTATWTFTGLPAGQYRVSATWSIDPNRATNSPYTILDNTTNLGMVRLNQETIPNHFVANGANWRNIGGPFTINSGTLIVRLADNANQYVIADAIRIERLTASPVTIVDDGDAGFSATGGFVTTTGQGFQSDFRSAAAGTGSEEATWTFAVTPGIYRVSVTWTPNANRATNAPYLIQDGTNVFGPYTINQEATPINFTFNGVGWQDLSSGVFAVTGNTFVIHLSDNANEFVVADAIRIERLS